MFMPTKRFTGLIILCLCTLLLCTACSVTPSPISNTGNTSPATSQPSATAQADSATNQSTISTACPATGTGRPAVMPTLQLGQDQNIVYIDTVSTLKRYDVQTRATATILNDGGNIGQAQISNDGQWILFTQNEEAIQLVRIDGKYLQTLYCAPQGQQIDPTTASGYSTGMQWSPNQKAIIFSQGKLGGNDSLFLLNMTSGQVQQEITASANQSSASSTIQPRTWVDNTRVYVTTQSSMYILDTSKGANQSFSDLQLVIGVSDTSWDFDSTYDGSKLFVVHDDPTAGRAGPGTFCQITASSVTGQNGKLIFSSNTLVPNEIRVAGYGSSTLLLSVNQRADPADKYNGLWKVNADGTGLVELAKQPNAVNMFGQYPWSNVSRDDQYYAYGTLFSSLNGGAPTYYTNSDSAIPVGWTTM